MKSYILIISLLTAQISMAANHIRFWRGYKQPQNTYQQFIDSISGKLIPMTVEVGAGRGLIAYMPSILPEAKPSYLPDEWAILTYESLEAYNALVKTPEWAAYGPLHYAPGYFAKKSETGKSSGTAVVEDYVPGQVFEDKAAAVKISWIDGDYQPHNHVIQYLKIRINGAETNYCMNRLLSRANKLVRQDQLLLNVTVFYDVDYVILVGTQNPNRSVKPSQLDQLSEGCFTKLGQDFFQKSNGMPNRPANVNFQF